MQANLIEFAFHLIEMKEWVAEFYRPLYYKILTLVLQWGEFDIGVMTLEKAAKEIIQLKVEIARDYQKLLYAVLEDSFELLNVKQLGLEQKNFLEISISICFFRVH